MPTSADNSIVNELGELVSRLVSPKSDACVNSLEYFWRFWFDKLERKKLEDFLINVTGKETKRLSYMQLSPQNRRPLLFINISFPSRFVYFLSLDGFSPQFVFFLVNETNRDRQKLQHL